MVNLPKFSVAPDDLPEQGLATKRTVTKTVRIDEDTQFRIEDLLHDPRLGFGGHFTSFALWAFEQGIYACAKASNDPAFKMLVSLRRTAQKREVRQLHMLTFNERLNKDAAFMEQWLKTDDRDYALELLEEMMDELDSMRGSNWYKTIAQKIKDNATVDHLLTAANSETGTSKQRQRAKAVTDVLEAATGQ